MNTEMEGTFVEPDGTQLFYRFCHDPNNKAGVVVCHGLGEHSGRYKNLYEKLTPGGYSYFALDHRGHGRSTGKRGRIRDFDQYVFGMKRLVDFAREKIGGKPLFLFGHSLGGLIALQFCLRFPETVRGLITSGPLLKLSLEVPPLKSAVGKILSGILPQLALGSEIDAVFISHDPEVIRDYENDPLVHDRISTRLFTEFIASMKAAQSRAAAMEMPLFMMHGGDDRLTHPEGTKQFFNAASSKDKTLKIYDGLFHELINETQKETVLADILGWLDQRA